MNISILLRHCGVWASEIVYERYKSDGIVVGDNISFMNLKSTIASVLEIDETRKHIDIRYIVSGNSSPIVIRNDMGVKLYLEVKKKEVEFAMYPLCITTTDKDASEVITFDADYGAVACVEGTDKDAHSLALVESSNGDSCYLPEVEEIKCISDRNNTEVKEKQLYKDKATLIAVMIKYRIDHNFNFRVKRSDKKSYVLTCYAEDCAWKMKASSRINSEVFKVRYFNDAHTCSLRDRLINKVQATVSFISGVTAPKLTNHKRIHTPNDIIEEIKSAYGIDISYQQAWRAKDRALLMIRGKPADGYREMPGYIHMLNIVYPNSYIRMHKSADNEFKYLFISLRPLIRGFEFCRPVVVVDGAHLGGAYKGTFVSASTLDGAGCILPLAYGVVDTEYDCSWSWFFQQFKNIFRERENMCFVSDRNESIIKSVSIIFPSVPHFACIWHVWKNVCTYFRKSRNTLSDLYYSMAKAYRKEDFDKLMAIVSKIDHRVKEYLENVGYEKWSRVHATVNRGRMMTSNIAECINGCLVEARELPILEFLEQARMLFGSWNCKNREIASYTKDRLGRKFEDILILNTSKCSRMTVKASSEYLYSVYESGKRYIVCLEKKTCNCGRFQIDEIPCPHAIAVLKSKNVIDIHPYCSDYYKPETLAKTYEFLMVPMPDKEDWNVPKEVLDEVVLPPKYKRPPGRPKKGRQKKSSEKITSSTNCCGRCGHEGHNRRTCNFFPKEN